MKQLRNVKRLNIIFAYASFAVDVHPNVQAQADELQREIKKLFPGSQIEVTVPNLILIRTRGTGESR